jgi:Domain of unknown function (DUF5666)
VATVSAIEGSELTLMSPDGWTRDVDTSAIAITRGSTPITVADVRVGDRVRVASQRGADGTWTVSRIQVLLSVVRGTVASVDAGSFRVTTGDGASVTVRVAADTTWLTGCRGPSGLGTLEVGSLAAARGVAAADGSIDASLVTVVAPLPVQRGPGRQRMRRLPVPTPTSPATSPAAPA